jgi:RimJ/RimL family protein N-acetyltransferase
MSERHAFTTWPVPQPRELRGKFVVLTPSDPEADADELFAAGHEPPDVRALWEFMPRGPYADVAEFREWMRAWQATPGTLPFTVTLVETGRRVGMNSIMRLTPEHGVAELGCIWYAPAVQRTKVNTETNYLLLRHLFDDLGYRRVEWKCDDRNARSRAAALRLGFTFEGIFRQHMMIKGRNRDTAWFAMIDREWPTRRANLERWLYTADSPPLSALNGVS